MIDRVSGDTQMEHLSTDQPSDHPARLADHARPRTQHHARYLVTGGAGFIGSHLLARLLAEGAAVRVLDNGATGDFGRLEGLHGLAGRLEVLRGDIRDAVEVARAMAGVERVFHQAAEVSVPRSVADPVGTYAVNVTGTLNVLEAARAAGVRRVVMASTSAIYGDDPEMPKREAMPPRPISPYASSKLAGEGLGAVYARCFEVETVALRYFNVYGPGQDPNSAYAAVIPKMIDLVRQGRSPVIYGDGEQTRDFVYVGDVVEANLLAMTSPVASGGVFNVASGVGISLNRMLALIGDVFGRELPAEHLPERAGDIRHSLADASLAAERLGFRATTPFAEGIRRTVAAGAAPGVGAAPLVSADGPAVETAMAGVG